MDTSKLMPDPVGYMAPSRITFARGHALQTHICTRSGALKNLIFSTSSTSRLTFARVRRPTLTFSRYICRHESHFDDTFAPHSHFHDTFAPHSHFHDTFAPHSHFHDTFAPTHILTTSSPPDSHFDDILARQRRVRVAIQGRVVADTVVHPHTGRESDSCRGWQ